MKLKNKKITKYLNIKKLLQNDVHLGHHKMLWNPKMAPFIYGVRQQQHIFDLNKTLVYMRKGLLFLTNVLNQKGSVLVVGYPLGYKNTFKKLLDDNNISWIDNGTAVGGLLTNWETHYNYRKKFYKEITQKTESRSLRRFEKSFGNIIKLDKKPDLIIFFNSQENKGLLRESVQMNIPIISFLDSKDDPTNIDYPIPSNTQSYKSSRFYMDLFSHILKKQS